MHFLLKRNKINRKFIGSVMHVLTLKKERKKETERERERKREIETLNVVSMFCKSVFHVNRYIQ